MLVCGLSIVQKEQKPAIRALSLLAVAVAVVVAVVADLVCV